jgi:hypothetical protein
LSRSFPRKYTYLHNLNYRYILRQEIPPLNQRTGRLTTGEAEAIEEAHPYQKLNNMTEFQEYQSRYQHDINAPIKLRHDQKRERTVSATGQSVHTLISWITF